MNLPDDCRLTYWMRQETWYDRDIRNPGDRPTIQIVAAADGGGCAWEFDIEEHDFRSHTAVRLRIFQDAWAAFVEVPELFAALAAEQPTTLAAVRAILERIGAVDTTDRVPPPSVRAQRLAQLRREIAELEALDSPPEPAPRPSTPAGDPQ